MPPQHQQLLERTLEPVVAELIRLALLLTVALSIALFLLAAVMLSINLILAWRERHAGDAATRAQTRRLPSTPSIGLAHGSTAQTVQRGRTGRPHSIAIHLPLLAATMACAGGQDGAAAADVDHEATADAVLRLENEMNAAVDALDCDTGMALIGDREPIFVANGRALDTRAELVEICAQMVGGRTSAEFDIEDIDAHVLSADAAYVVRRGDYTIHGMDGTSNTVYLIMTTVWHREPEGWKMVHLHESVRMPPPDSAQ